MLALKDTDELLGYFYDVCEVSACDEESTDFYESDTQALNLCENHYREISNKYGTW